MLLTLPDELLSFVLHHCTLDALMSSAKPTCRALRAAVRRALHSREWLAGAHGWQLGQPLCEQEPVQANHREFWPFASGVEKGGLIAIAPAGPGSQQLLGLVARRRFAFDADGWHQVKPAELVTVTNDAAGTMTKRLLLSGYSVARALAADATHGFLLGHSGRIERFLLDDLSAGRMNPLAASSVVARPMDEPEPEDFEFTLWPDRNYRMACAHGHLYLADCEQQLVKVMDTSTLEVVLSFDVSSATPPQLPAEHAAAGAASATVEVSADALEMIEDGRGSYHPVGLAVSDDFVFVCLQCRDQQGLLPEETFAEDLDCVGVFRRETGELSHTLGAGTLQGVEAVAVFHDRLYVLSVGTHPDARRYVDITNVTDGSPAFQTTNAWPALHWMNFHGEDDSFHGIVELMPDGYEGSTAGSTPPDDEDPHSLGGLDAMGCLHVDDARGELLLALKASCHVRGKQREYSLCIPMQLSGRGASGSDSAS